MTVLRLPVSVDPLIAEAKERARRRRLLLAGVALVAACAIGATVVLESGRPAGGARSAIAPVPRAAVGGFGHSDFKGGRLTWATNNRSRVWLSTNDGRTWRLAPLPGLQRGTFIGADFIDPAHGWGVSDLGNRAEVARTTDGGRTWRASFVRGSAWSFHFRTPARGYVVVAEPRGAPIRYVTTRYMTTDGGATWKRVAPASKLLHRRHALKVVSTGPGPGDPNSWLTRTDDYGRHWTRVPLPGNPNIKDFKSFGRLRVVLGYVPRDWTRLAVDVSADGGRHWTLRMAPKGMNPGGQQDACCFNVSAPVAGAWYAIANGLYVTHDAGRTWHVVPASGLWRHFHGIDLGPIDFVDARVGWELAGTTLLRTTDGGRHWAPAGPRLPEERKHG